MRYRLESLVRAGAVLALCLAAGCQFKNNPPDTPAAPTGPTEVPLWSTPSYVASAVDPDGDSVYLSFNTDLDNYGDRWSGLVASGDTVSQQFNPYSIGTFTVRVRALDEHGYYSDWSQMLTITVEESAGRMKDGSGQDLDTKKESQ